VAWRYGWVGRPVSALTPRLIALGALLARRYGVVAVQALARSGQAWLADPANEATKAQLVAQLREWSAKAGGTAAQSAAVLARQVERRGVSPSAWERDLMELRYELPSMPHGRVREAALRAYESQLRAGVHLISHARRPERTREHVIAALRAEGRMLHTERIEPAERDRLLAAVDASVDACGGMFRPAGPGGRRDA